MFRVITTNKRFPDAIHLAPSSGTHTEGFVVGRFGASLWCGRTALLTEIPEELLVAVTHGDPDALAQLLIPGELPDHYSRGAAKVGIVGAPYEAVRWNPDQIIEVKSGLSDIEHS